MNIESLEARRLFDASVTHEGSAADTIAAADSAGVTVTEGYPGFYEIHGTEESDLVEVSINMGQETLTVNGQTYPGVVYVMAYGYGGDDAIIINSEDGIGRIGASVSAGDGDDMIACTVDGAIWAGPGNDELTLHHAFRGEAYGEDGNDYMYISGLTTDAAIYGGGGDDFIDCSSNFYGVVVFGGVGNDTILGSQYADELHGEQGQDLLEGNGGNDTFYAWGGGADIINGGSGDDIAYVDAERDSADAEEIYYM